MVATLFPLDVTQTLPPVLMVPRPVKTFVADEAIVQFVTVPMAPDPIETALALPELIIQALTVRVPVEP